MRRFIPCVVLLALASVALAADGAIELSVMQSAFAGDHFTGTIGSLRLASFTAPQPLGQLDVFADGGVRFSETANTELVGGLVGASIGPRDNALRVGAGWQYPGGVTVYMRAVVMRW